MTIPKIEARENLVLRVANFLSNQKAPNYKKIVKNILASFQTLGANMSTKLEKSDAPGSKSDEKKLSKLMRRHLLADHFWYLKRLYQLQY